MKRLTDFSKGAEVSSWKTILQTTILFCHHFGTPWSQTTRDSSSTSSGEMETQIPSVCTSCTPKQVCSLQTCIFYEFMLLRPERTRTTWTWACWKQPPREMWLPSGSGGCCATVCYPQDDKEVNMRDFVVLLWDRIQGDICQGYSCDGPRGPTCLARSLEFFM